MTQCERILDYIDQHGSITRADLRRDGVELAVETATQKNRYGETVRFARYRRANGQ